MSEEAQQSNDVTLTSTKKKGKKRKDKQNIDACTYRWPLRTGGEECMWQSIPQQLLQAENTDCVPQLPFFPIHEVNADSAMLVYGIRRTGKSFFMRWLLSHMNHLFPWVIMMTKTKINGFWQQCIPERFIHEHFDSAVLAYMLRMQEDAITKERTNPDPRKPNLRKLIGFDDVISQEDIHSCKALEDCYTRGRHLQIFVFLLTQHTKAVSPTIRTNCDFVVVFRMFSKQQKMSIYEDYLSFMPKQEAFTLMDYYTEKRGVLIIKNDPTASNPWNNLSWARATEVPNYRLGCAEVWREQDQQMDQGG